MRGVVELSLLSVILLTAVYSDLRRNRIPNWLNLFGLVAGIGLQVATSGAQGLVSGALGVLVGLACFAPFYLLRAMGAGDVKLLAAVGSFTGPEGAFYAALGSLLAGGAAAIGYVAWCVVRASIRTLVHEGFAAASASAFVAASIARRDRLPFALPIAVGGMVAWWNQFESTGAAIWLRGGHT